MVPIEFAQDGGPMGLQPSVKIQRDTPFEAAIGFRAVGTCRGVRLARDRPAVGEPGGTQEFPPGL